MYLKQNKLYLHKINIYMDKQIITNKAIDHYKENVEGEPLTENVPIDCYIKGAEFIISVNKVNYKQALKTLKPIQNSMIEMNLHAEWMTILNALRLSAGMELIKLKNKTNV